MKKSELNKNENTTTYQKLWDTAKAVLRGRFIELYIQMEKKL